MADEGEFPKIDGDILFSSDVNSFTNRIMNNYFGNAADFSSSIDITGSHVLDFIPVGSLFGFKNTRLTLSHVSSATPQGNTSNTPQVLFNVKHREISGTYTDVGNGELILTQITGNVNNAQITGNYNVVHELNAAELSSGVQFMMVSRGNVDSASDSVGFTNKGFSVELV